MRRLALPVALIAGVARCGGGAGVGADEGDDGPAGDGKSGQDGGEGQPDWHQDPGCSPPAVARPAGSPFADVTFAWGFGGAMVSGACMLDAEGDGDQDLFMAGNQALLFRNNGAGTFTPSSLLEAGELVIIGCLAFDYDHDWDSDLFLTRACGVGQSCGALLLRNDNGAFTDVTEEAGLVTPGFEQSATAGDIEGDGDLDVCVATLFGNPAETSSPQPDLLLVNDGAGHFTEEAAARGLTAAEPTFTVLFVDIDGDGDVDLHVGNDGGLIVPDRMYLNDGAGSFKDGGAMMRLDFDDDHDSSDTMGVDVGDWDLDGFPDLVVTNYDGRPTQLYDCDADLVCRNLAAEVGLESSGDYTNWGIGLEDFDHDMDLDLFEVSGCNFSREKCASPPVDVEDQLFWNEGGALARYLAPPGDALALNREGRGLAFGDLDGDGDQDIAIANFDGVQVLRNDAAAGHWLRVLLRGTTSNADGVGARVTVQAAGGCAMTEQRIAGGSFLSSHDPHMHFGLGPATSADVTVIWPSGLVQTLEDEAADRTIVIAEGIE